MTLDELWEAYENKDQDFAGDVYDFMKTDLPFKITKEEFGRQYGMYLPEFDYTGIELGEREKEIGHVLSSGNRRILARRRRSRFWSRSLCG